MTLLGASHKTFGRYPEDTMRSVRICLIPWFLYSIITFQLSLRFNRLVTLPAGLYKAGRDPLQTHVIAYDSQYKPTDHESRVLRHTDGLNLSNSCVSVAFLFLIILLSADQSTFVGYLSKVCRRQWDSESSSAWSIQWNYNNTSAWSKTLEAKFQVEI